MLSAMSVNNPIAARGAVNRLGNHRPRAWPMAEDVTTANSPTRTGHQIGPPQVAWNAVTVNTTTPRMR
ncbi:hypothetical protein GCM10029964_087010 [Kibdelosporangium lantanae]